MIEIIGHRGARGLEPENTMRSFQKALELCVDLICADRPDIVIKEALSR